MIFIERPITAEHIRAVCATYSEGLRVEYKSTFNEDVKDKLPKIVSSFANSQGGVLIIGVATLKGVPQPPFNGFEARGREEYPLTVESICMKGIQPPVFPRTHVVEDAGRTFLVIEVDESGQAPHAIENSRKVYVRTGNASDPYDLAKVDEIIDLMKRRQEPLELRKRILSFAENRAIVNTRGNPYFQISICPTYPRGAMCSSKEIWDLLNGMQFSEQVLVPANSIRRVSDGAAAIVRDPNIPSIPGHYVEINRYGLLFALRRFTQTGWEQPGDQRQQLHFGDLFHALLRLSSCAKKLYDRNGYHGHISLQISLHHVRGQSMRFVDRLFMDVDSPGDFECYSDDVSAERFGLMGEIFGESDILLDILCELTWAFCQSTKDYPRERMKTAVQKFRQEVGL
jgi:hypothetical protein